MSITKNITNQPPHSMNNNPLHKNTNAPKPLNQHTIALTSNPHKHDQIVLYHNPTQIVLQFRNQFTNEDNVLTPAIKVACELSPAEALALASTLLAIATPRINAMMSHPPDGPKAN